MDNKQDQEIKQSETPPIGILGEAGGYMMPRTAEGLVYNPETISLSNFIEMEDDAQIKAVLTIVKAPITNVTWSISSDDPDIAKFCYANLVQVWGNFIRNVLNAINFGFQGFEKVFIEKDSSWMYDEFLDLYPPSVTLKKDLTNSKFAGIEQQTSKEKVQIPPEKSFVFSIDKRFGNLYGRSRLRSAYMYWFIDKYTYDFENMFYERYAMPIVEGKAPRGKTQTGGDVTNPSMQDNLQLLLDKIKALRNASAIVIPSDVDPVTKAEAWSVKFLEAQRRGGDFTQRHNHLDMMKARAIFAPELVFSSPYAGSSYALAREHATIFLGAEEALIFDIKTHIDKYILPQLVRYNFGVNAPRAEWVFESISTETKNMVRDLVMSMVEGGLIRPDPEWLAKTLKVKLQQVTPSQPTPEEVAKDKGKLKAPGPLPEQDTFRSDKGYNKKYGLPTQSRNKAMGAYPTGKAPIAGGKLPPEIEALLNPGGPTPPENMPGSPNIETGGAPI